MSCSGKEERKVGAEKGGKSKHCAGDCAVSVEWQGTLDFWTFGGVAPAVVSLARWVFIVSLLL